MTFWDFISLCGRGIYNHKTKIVGVTIAVLGFVQADPHLRNLLSTQHYAAVMSVTGLLVTALGFLNSWKPTLPPTQ